MNSKDLLSQIAKNLEQIAKERDEYKKSNSDQQIQIEALKSQIKDLKITLENSLIKDNNNNKQSELSSSTKHEEMKLKIDGLVEEIDECLALLNN